MIARLLHVVALCSIAFVSSASAQVRPLIHDASDAFFGEVEIPELRVWIDPRQMDRLTVAPREYVCGVLIENDGARYAPVGVKLKGAAGSYRNWDDRPALTLNMTKFNKHGRFHGLKKFHLNNSVQDATYLNELVASELFLRAGVPTPRVTFARVWLNDRDVGFYVLKEGFDELFVKRYFANGKGNLYEGAFCGDVDRELEKDGGDGPDDHSDLKAVTTATGLSDVVERRREIEKVVDVDEFATFMAMERLTGHWDGYCGNRNNYRIYFHNGKAVFLPHGMDQMFGGGANLFEGSGARVASALWSDPEFRPRYFRRAAAAIQGITATESLLARVDQAAAKMQPVLAKMDRGRAEQHTRDVAGMKQRLVERAAVVRQNVAAERANLPIEFDPSGVVSLRDWYQQPSSGSATLDEPTLDGRRAWHINSNGQPCVASWRCKFLLGPGVYTLSAEVRTREVVAADDNQSGVGLGVSGSPRPQRLSGTIDKQTATYELTVRDDRRTPEFVIELRAKSGEVWFDADSLKLTRKPLP